MTPATDAKTPHYMVRLAFRVRSDAASGPGHVGYLFPAAYFSSGEHAERFGMCLWATRHRDVVALHVFPPVSGRSLAPDGWSIAEPVHVDCGSLLRRRIPAIAVAPGGSMWLQEAGASTRLAGDRRTGVRRRETGPSHTGRSRRGDQLWWIDRA